ncbi:MAG: endonuclease domain-containing protein [Thermoleophilaceae bacterium]
MTTPRGQHPRPGIRFHRSQIPPDETTVKDAIPITTVPRTLFDLATVLNPPSAPPGHQERKSGARKAPGRRQPHQERPRGDVYRLRGQARLPRPETNVYVEGFEVDAVWREQRVIIEVDGWETHRTRAAFERDREKSRVLQARGWRCVPVTFLQLRDASQEVASDVRRLLATTARTLAAERTLAA